MAAHLLAHTRHTGALLPRVSQGGGLEGLWNLIWWVRGVDVVRYGERVHVLR